MGFETIPIWPLTEDLNQCAFIPPDQKGRNLRQFSSFSQSLPLKSVHQGDHFGCCEGEQSFRRTPYIAQVARLLLSNASPFSALY